MTHYIQWIDDVKLFGRALCGVLVLRTNHASVPTCPICFAALVASRYPVAAGNGDQP